MSSSTLSVAKISLSVCLPTESKAAFFDFPSAGPVTPAKSSTSSKFSTHSFHHRSIFLPESVSSSGLNSGTHDLMLLSNAVAMV